MSEKDSAAALAETIERYNQAWNDHDLDAIVSMHAPDMVYSDSVSILRQVGLLE